MKICRKILSGIAGLALILSFPSVAQAITVEQSIAGAAEVYAYSGSHSRTSIVAQAGMESNTLTEQEYAELISAFENSEWGKKAQSYGQDRSVGTAAIKKALQWALHHERDIVKGVEKWVGKDPARRVEKVIYDISPTLHTLLRYEDLVWQTVQDQLSPVIGRDLAYWITKVIEWIAPV
ncbi:hypothetical protein [Corynebacterium sp. HS2168-gen11]|uniref:hypothetical protein n=1 Tax=Corynebacterium sp. HS2168-gen11 TaxID=2974027 RepID=UPI00216B1D91|nr:hypothetical protein [Corynebacterium sp. HS2168-gen11]MCS4536038.1 hypothetical protein [Corynebacterium sp. HS2168-gen11]